jgi:hypothetical protein
VVPASVGRRRAGVEVGGLKAVADFLVSVAVAYEAPATSQTSIFAGHRGQRCEHAKLLPSRWVKAPTKHLPCKSHLSLSVFSSLLEGN